MNLSERGAFGTLLGQVHIIPNHRGQPIQIREDGPTMPVTGGGHSIRADRVLGWGSQPPTLSIRRRHQRPPLSSS